MKFKSVLPFSKFLITLIRIPVAKLLQLFCITLSLMHNNCGSFSYLNGITAYQSQLSLVGNMLIRTDDAFI